MASGGPAPSSARHLTTSPRGKPCSGCTGATSGGGTTSSSTRRGVSSNTPIRCTARECSRPTAASSCMADPIATLTGYWRSCFGAASGSSTRGLSSETQCVCQRTCEVFICTGAETAGRHLRDGWKRSKPRPKILHLDPPRPGLGAASKACSATLTTWTKSAGTRGWFHGQPDGFPADEQPARRTRIRRDSTCSRCDGSLHFLTSADIA